MADTHYPALPGPQKLYGVYPVDFLLEVVLRAGLDWFRTTADSENIVFHQLTQVWLAKYNAKPAEFKAWVQKYELDIVQHFSKIDRLNPCISIQILDAVEREDRAGLEDHAGVTDILNEENELTGRKQDKYSPISDNIHIGIHANQPDMAKYLYYLVIYLLNSFKPQLQEKGLQLSTFRATDISLLNQYLPENIYSRFINFSVFTWALIDGGDMPLLEEILGVHMATSSPEEPTEDRNGDPMPTCDEDGVDAERVTETFGLHACDIRDEENG